MTNQLFPNSKNVFSTVDISKYIKAMQSKHPLIHCITNTVVQNFTANMLLAVGASPAMVIAEEEVESFAAIADGLLINIGTVTRSSAKSMILAAQSAHKHQTPWVLDPVAVGSALPYRTEIARELLSYNPTLIRGNASEILALNEQHSNSKGADSGDDVTVAVLSADELAIKHQTTVVLTGEVDYVTNGEARLSIPGGHIDLTRVTGVGCSLSALTAAFIASHPDTLNSAASACALMAKAAENANKAEGLGTFSVSLLNHLSTPPLFFNFNTG